MGGTKGDSQRASGARERELKILQAKPPKGAMLLTGKLGSVEGGRNAKGFGGKLLCTDKECFKEELRSLYVQWRERTVGLL